MKDKKADRQLILFFAITLAWTWSFGFAPVIMGIEGTPLGLVIGVGYLNFEMPGMEYIYSILNNPLNVFLILFLSLISGPLNEEFGWRGFALDRLFKRFGFTGGTFVLGFIWAIWHLAWFFTPGQAQYNLLQSSVFDAVMYILSVMLLNFAVSFVYVKTKRSILAGAMVHMFGNLMGSQLLSPYGEEISMTIRYTKMFFCGCIALYCVLSRKFNLEFKELYILFVF